MGVVDLRRRVEDILLPRFCAHPKRSNYTADGYQGDWEHVSDGDAEDCLLAIDHILTDEAYYFAAQKGRSKELLFHEIGNQNPRPIRVAHETIITFATLARLHFELNWPQRLLGGESTCGALDAGAFMRAEDEHEFVACEIKSSSRELEKLIRYILLFASDPERDARQSESNAYKKVVALRKRRPPFFWAVGPDRESTAFTLTYQDQGVISLSEARTAILRFPG